MHPDHRQAKKKFTDKIAIADRIETVLAHPGKAELARDRLSIEDDCRSSQCAGPEWQDIRSRIAITKTFRVTLEGFDLGKLIIREKNRLCALQMRVTRHHNIDVLLREIEQRGLQ